MSATSKGKRAEKRVRDIFTDFGFTLAAEAKNTGGYRAGKWVSGGSIDLVKNSIDHIFIKRGRRTLFIQVCHVGGESPRRAKMRAVGFDPAFHEAILMAWDADLGMFRTYRDVDDYLVGPGWFINEDSNALPWEESTRQMTL